MIYHQVRLAVKKDAPSDQLETALGLLRRMGEEIDVVESYQEVKAKLKDS